MFQTLIKRLHALRSDHEYGGIVSDSARVFAAKIIALATGLVFNLAVVRMYGAESMGLLALVNSFFSIALLFSLIGTNTSILRFIPEYTQRSGNAAQVRIYFKIALIVLGTSLVVSFLANRGASIAALELFHSEEMTALVATASLFVVFKAFTDLNTNTLRAQSQIHLFSWLIVVAPLLNIALLFGLQNFWSDRHTPVYVLLASSVLVAAVSFGMLAATFRRHARNRAPDDTAAAPTAPAFREVFSVSMPMFLTASMGAVISNIDVLMLSAFSGAAEVGHYAIAVKLATLSGFVLTSINIVIAPKFSEYYYKQNLHGLQNVVRRSSKLIFWTALPPIVILALFGRPILAIFSPEFVSAYPVLLVMLLGQFVNVSVGSVGYLMNMTGYHKQYNMIMMAAALANIGLNYALIPFYGMEGAAVATMLTMLLWNLASWTYIYRKLGFASGYLPFLVRTDRR